jgi:hypothetical protein
MARCRCPRAPSPESSPCPLGAIRASFQMGTHQELPRWLRPRAAALTGARPIVARRGGFCTPDKPGCPKIDVALAQRADGSPFEQDL